ncbi:MAG: hypothetical protein RIS29_2613 [Bacteroidota bacterium]|jgi:hypothetical protein
MNVVIDTSSLLSLVRYYLPFDKEDKLKTLIHAKVESGEIIVLDKVAEECGYVAGGIVLKELPFLAEKHNQTKTTELFPPKAFFNMLDNQFVNSQLKNKLSESEFEARKTAYLENADAKILLYAYTQNKQSKPFTVVSEESSAGNDDKMFKKIPTICSSISINCIQFPELLQKYNEIEVRF